MELGHEAVLELQDSARPAAWLFYILIGARPKAPLPWLSDPYPVRISVTMRTALCSDPVHFCSLPLPTSLFKEHLMLATFLSRLLGVGGILRLPSRHTSNTFVIFGSESITFKDKVFHTCEWTNPTNEQIIIEIVLLKFTKHPTNQRNQPKTIMQRFWCLYYDQANFSLARCLVKTNVW